MTRAEIALPWLLTRVDVDPASECWLWKPSIAGSGVPMVQIGRGRQRSARRVAWELLKGPIAPGRHPTATCGDRRCINPDHAELRSRGGYMKLARANGLVIHDAAWRAKVAVAKRAGSPLDWEKVREIRRRGAAGESQASRARAFGVSQTTIYHIDSGKHWVEPAASALAMLARQAGMLP